MNPFRCLGLSVSVNWRIGELWTLYSSLTSTNAAAQMSSVTATSEAAKTKIYYRNFRILSSEVIFCRVRLPFCQSDGKVVHLCSLSAPRWPTGYTDDEPSLPFTGTLADCCLHRPHYPQQQRWDAQAVHLRANLIPVGDVPEYTLCLCLFTFCEQWAAVGKVIISPGSLFKLLQHTGVTGLRAGKKWCFQPTVPESKSHPWWKLYSVLFFHGCWT